MSNNTGLGRGLDSLIPNKQKTSVPATPTAPVKSKTVDLFEAGDQEMVLQLSVNKIKPNPHQPRKTFNEEDQKELMNSIKEHGIIQPLIVTKISDNTYQLVAGERRLRAAQELKMETVPAIIRDLDEQKKLEVALIENIQRKNLNALESAKAYKKLMDEFGFSLSDLSAKLGKSLSAISNTIRILKASKAVKSAIEQGKISETHARTLAGLPEEDQVNLLNRIVEEKISSRDTERESRKIVVKKHLRKVSVDPELDAKSNKLEEALGTKVEIKKHGHAGQIIIRFYSNEELNEIIDKLA